MKSITIPLFVAAFLFSVPAAFAFADEPVVDPPAPVEATTVKEHHGSVGLHPIYFYYTLGIPMTLEGAQEAFQNEATRTEILRQWRFKIFGYYDIK